MATVYLARDFKHDRLVALKVLHPELGHALGPARFLREIRLTAQLQHPQVLSVHDSGESDGLLWYTMPFVEGESLRQRLKREKQLPVEDALRIGRDIAEALGYAHSRNIVHRDIKPENVLLSHGPPGGRAAIGEQPGRVRALVADFGIAKALDAAGGERLTESGLSLGTPAYMSPEQATGASDLDGRSDIYSLGCVLYEMLTGEPPFTGPSAQAILARHVVDQAAPLRTVRRTVPEGVEKAILRALEKVPVDRFATVEQFARALTSGEHGSRQALSLPSSRRIVAGLAAAVSVIALAVGAFLRWHSRPGAEVVDPRLVAVLPFRVAGADFSLAYLREGIVDLLAVKLTGEGGPRALDPRAVLSSWHRALPWSAEDLPPRAAVDIARRLGAGRLIDGGVVGTSDHLVLTASVVTVPSGATRSRASVAGVADSLPVLIDRLTAQLLAGEAGRTELATLTSLPALRAYLDGQSELRAGRFKDAFRSFNHALEVDSTFLLAGIGLGRARFWDGGNDSGRGFRLAWAGRDRLSPRDRAIIAPWMVPGEEHLATAQLAVTALPESPEAWYELGDDYYHGGGLQGMDAPLRRAAAAFRRALELDSSMAEPRIHLFEIAAAEGDTAAIRRLGNMAMAADSANDDAGYFRWQMAYTLGNTAALAALRAGFDQLSDKNLRAIAVRSQEFGATLDDARRAAAVLLKRAVSDSARRAAMRLQYELALNGGRPHEALGPLVESERTYDQVGHWPGRVMDALYWGGDSGAAAVWVRNMASYVDGPLLRGVDERRTQFDDICTMEQWRVAHGQLAAHAAIRRLRAAFVPGLPARDSASVAAHASMCADLLEAWPPTGVRRPVDSALVARLDSLSRRRPEGWWADGWNLVLAQMLEARGDLHEALATVRRRPYGFGHAEPYLSSYLREEGRLAALVGDTTGAISAYRHFLALRSDPEPPFRAERDRARAEVARLVGQH